METVAGSTLAPRARAMLEVMFAFTCMHLGFRAIQRFTAWGDWESVTGMNFAPGLCMLVVALLMVAARNHAQTVASRLSAHGLKIRPWFASLGAGLLSVLVLSACGAVLLAAGVQVANARHAWPAALAVFGGNLFATGALLWTLRRLERDRWSRLAQLLRVPGALLLVGVLAAPVLVALWEERTYQRQLLTVLWIVIGSAIGEEVFFRGYVQTRLNSAFGKPWSLQGVPFGPGLLLASMLFGLVHLLNPFDYFGGELALAWPHAVATVATLYFGFLRERTGGVLAPAIVHALTNLGGRLPELLGNGPS